MGIKKPNNSFINWIESRLDDDSRALLFKELLGYVTVERNALLEQIIGSMSMDEQGDLVNDMVDDLHNRGYDWKVFREEGEVI